MCVYRKSESLVMSRWGCWRVHANVGSLREARRANKSVRQEWERLIGEEAFQLHVLPSERPALLFLHFNLRACENM